MRKGKSQVHSPAEDAALWKKKYLQSLDELESIVKRWSRRSRLLRQGLVSVSCVADNDRQLDKHLGEMDMMLKRDDLPGLAGVIDDIERDARRVETDSRTNSAAVSGITRSLRRNCFAAISSRSSPHSKDFGATL